MIVGRASAEIVALVATALATIMTVRTIGPAMAGNLAVTSTLFYAGTVIVGGGIPSFGAQRVALDEAGGHFVRSALSARLVLALAWFGVVQLVVAILPFDAALAALIRSTTLGAFAIAAKHEWYLVGRGRVGMVSVVRASSALATVAVAVIFVRAEDTVGLTLFVLAGPVLAAGLSSLFAGRLLVARPRLFDGPDIGIVDALRGGLHYLKADVSIFVYNNSDRPFVYLFGGAAAAGLYDAAYKLIQPFSAVSGVISDTMFRALATVPRAGRPHTILLRRYVDRMFVATIPVGFFTLGFGQQVVDLVYGHAFAGAGPLLGVLGWVVSAGYVSGVFAMPLAAWQAPREYGNSILAGSIANLLLNIALIPQLMGIGAALATVGAKLVVAAFALTPFRARSSYPVVRDLSAYGMASGVALLSGVGMMAALGNHGVGPGVFVLVYLVVVLVVRSNVPFPRPVLRQDNS
jgi:O-antigen/teichoic acid export membrane protein